MPVSFRIDARCGHARVGRLETPHGEIETPAFMPVATLGAVKGMLPGQLVEAGAQIVLGNLYHLSLRPGVEIIEELGGLHAFMGWEGPILTDSGGYQVYSLAHRRRLDEDGVTFRNHLDGSEHRLTPRSVIDDQRRLGVDVAMVLDECPPGEADRETAVESLRRTRRWAELSVEEWERRPGDGGLFGILQGATYRDLRERAVEEVTCLPFDGFAVGGVSVGESDELRRRVVEWTAPVLPEEKPRYLMGIGYPDDLVHAVEHGVDLFDCVIPSRHARHGQLFTSEGRIPITTARYRRDGRPVDPACGCPTCRQVSRALLHHLLRHDRFSGEVLATIHNVSYYLDFARRVRQAIRAAPSLPPDRRRSLSIPCH